MKKNLTLLALAILAVSSCSKNVDTPIINPATEVLPADEQRQRFKTTAEAALDQVDSEAINAEIEKVLNLSNEDFSNIDEEGVIVRRIENAIESLTSYKGNIEKTIYELYPFRGHYSLINNQQSFTEADDIIVNYNNEWVARIVFSTNVQQILFCNYSSPYSNNQDYVKVPETTSILIQRSGETILTANVNINTNITDVATGFDPSKNLSVVASLNVAGYDFLIEKVSYANYAAACKTSISHKGVELLSENLNVSGIEFEDQIPTGAGKASFYANIMNSIQIKANSNDVSAFINNYEKMESNYKSETNFKYYLSNLNSLVENGIYFSSDIKQCYFELYPFQNNYSGDWYAVPVFVLADGTKYEDITGFFSKSYFESVIEKFEALISSLNI